MGYTPVYSNGSTNPRPKSRPRKSSTAPASFDRVVLIGDVNGKVYLRCYTGSDYVDAAIPYGCLAVLVSAGAKMLSHLYQKVA